MNSKRSRPGPALAAAFFGFAAVAMATYGWVRLKDPYIALFFGYLAYMSFIALQGYMGRNRW